LYSVSAPQPAAQPQQTVAAVTPVQSTTGAVRD